VNFVVLVGNPKPQSTTLEIARLAAEAVSRHAGPRAWPSSNRTPFGRTTCSTHERSR
jgi:hypothetical protein